MRRAVLASRSIGGLEKLLLVELAERPGAAAGGVELAAGDVAALCGTCERTARRLLASVEASGLVVVERLSGSASRLRWNMAHDMIAPLVAPPAERAARPPSSASSASSVELPAVDRELVEELGAALVTAKRRRLGVPVIGRAALPHPSACALLASWLRDQSADLGLARAELAAHVAAAFVAHDGRDNALRDAGWPLAWLVHDRERIATRIARRLAALRAAPPVVAAASPVEPAELARLLSRPIGVGGVRRG